MNASVDAKQKAALRAYVAALNPAARRAFKRARAAIRDAVPDVEEGFSYRIPAFRLDGVMLVWCAGWTAHLSVYPVTPAMEKVGGARLARYRASKGTLKFALDEALPTDFIAKLVRARVAEIRE